MVSFGTNKINNIMKTRILYGLLALILLNSCIVKSIQPFYTKNHLKFNKALVGKWKDQKNNSWKIASFKEEWQAENKDQTKLMKEDLEAFENYKEGYVISYERSKKEALFIGMPFTVNKHLFLDMTPLEYESEELNSLVAQHLLKTHSTAYVQFNDNKTITLKWLSEKVVKRLFNEEKLRLKHEEAGIDDDLILTATSEELHAFLKTFMATELDNKWDSDDVYTLTSLDATD